MTANEYESRSVIDFLSTSSDPQSALVSLLLKNAHKTQPFLADMLCIAAVPRKFDASLLSTLSQRKPGDKDVSTALRDLISMPFITRSRDGRYRMHDEIRRALLYRFQNTDAGREELRTLNHRLADYYAGEHEAARKVADQFDTVDVLLRTVSPDRVPAIRSAVEDQLVRPLLEAQHYRTVADPTGSGLAQFRRLFKVYETEGRFGVCRLLLGSWRDDIARLADEDSRGLHDWATYYEARLAASEGEGGRARKITEKLLARPGVDPKIRVRSQLLVTDSLITDCRFVDALHETATQIILRGENDPDPWSRSLVHLQQAKIHDKLYDCDAQVSSLARALEAARSSGNRESEARILGDLSAALARQGNIFEACMHSLYALHIVRTLNVSGDSRHVSRAARECATQLMRTFGSRDPRLADLFHAEASHLTRGDDTRRTLDLEISYVFALVGSGRFDRAHRVLDQLEERIDDQRPLERSGVLISRANLLDAEGRVREAIERNRQTVQEMQRQRNDRFSIAAALTNEATSEMDIGELLGSACTSAQRARDLWLAMEHMRGVALTNVVEAEVTGAQETMRLLGMRLVSARNEPWAWKISGIGSPVTLPQMRGGLTRQRGMPNSWLIIRSSWGGCEKLPRLLPG